MNYGYVRVSTDKQALSPEGQRNVIEATATRMGHRIDAWFQDAPVRNKDGSWNDAVSGKVHLGDRTAGKELVARLKKGDVVFADKVDRAFRKLSDCVIMLDRWERVGVGLMLCDFPMLSDLTNPFGKAMIQIVAVFAEIERKLISQRTKEALALRKRKGQANNQFAGYGFTFERKWDKDRRKFVKVKVACPEERALMQQVLKWRVEGYTWDAIAMQFDKLKVMTKHKTPWSKARIFRAFQAELKLQAA